MSSRGKDKFLLLRVCSKLDKQKPTCEMEFPWQGRDLAAGCRAGTSVPLLNASCPASSYLSHVHGEAKAFCSLSKCTAGSTYNTGLGARRGKGLTLSPEVIWCPWRSGLLPRRGVYQPGTLLSAPPRTEPLPTTRKDLAEMSRCELGKPCSRGRLQTTFSLLLTKH